MKRLKWIVIAVMLLLSVVAYLVWGTPAVGALWGSVLGLWGLSGTDKVVKLKKKARGIHEKLIDRDDDASDFRDRLRKRAARRRFHQR